MRLTHMKHKHISAPLTLHITSRKKATGLLRCLRHKSDSEYQISQLVSGDHAHASIAVANRLAFEPPQLSRAIREHAAANTLPATI